MSRRYEMSYRDRSRRARRERAQYIDRCRLLLAAILGTVAMCIAFGAIVLRPRASSNAEDDITYKYYKSIVIAYDYDLDDAAAEYADEHYEDTNDYLQEVCSINHFMSANDATPGTNVIVPYYSTEFR